MEIVVGMLLIPQSQQDSLGRFNSSLSSGQTDLAGLRSVLFRLSTISLSLSPAEGNFVVETRLAKIHGCILNENADRERRVFFI